MIAGIDESYVTETVSVAVLPALSLNSKLNSFTPGSNSTSSNINPLFVIIPTTLFGAFVASTNITLSFSV